MPNGALQKPILLLFTEQKKSLRELNLVTNLLKRSLNVLKPSAITSKMHLTPCKPSILISKRSSKGNSKKLNQPINANAKEPLIKPAFAGPSVMMQKSSKKPMVRLRFIMVALAKVMV